MLIIYLIQIYNEKNSKNLQSISSVYLIINRFCSKISKSIFIDTRYNYAI